MYARGRTQVKEIFEANAELKETQRDLLELVNVKAWLAFVAFVPQLFERRHSHSRAQVIYDSIVGLEGSETSNYGWVPSPHSTGVHIRKPYSSFVHEKGPPWSS